MDAKPASRIPVFIWLLASQLLALASLIFWLLAAGYSVTAFDPVGTRAASSFVIAVRAYPIWPIAFAVAAWIAYTHKRDKLAAVLTMFAFLPMLLLILLFLLPGVVGPVPL